jgi:hypothetical protein
MGTRSDIIVQRADGKWHRIYVHWDGYLSHNGKILFDHYTSQEQVEKLVALGDLSILGSRTGSKHPFEAPSRYLPGGDSLKSNPAYDAYDKKYHGMCLAYGRDRGEKDVAGTISDSLAEVWARERLLDRIHLRLDGGTMVRRRSRHRNANPRKLGRRAKRQCQANACGQGVRHDHRQASGA